MPQGEVYVLDFLSGETLLGRAAILVKVHDDRAYATILGLDVVSGDASLWSHMAAGIESFARDLGATHINALASFAPWCDALERQGFRRLRGIPFWLRDKSGAFVGAEAWHLTAMESDLGYLLP